VKGTSISKVNFSIDGKRVRTVKKSPFSFTLRSRDYGVGVHRLTAKITFKRGTGTASKTEKLTFRRCAKKSIAPKFTG
jgi:hypothetical protein